MFDRNPTVQKPHVYIELNDMSGWCCLMVVLVHILSPGVTGADKGSWQFAAVYLLQLFAIASVPGFLFLSGVKLGLAHSSGTVQPYPAYMKHRVTKLYLPYLGWTVLYYMVLTVIGYVQGSLSELVHHLIYASLSAQFYYVLAVMQFYLLRPLWLWMVEHLSWKLSLPLTLAVTLAAPQIHKICADLCPSVFQYGGRLVIFYVFYLAAGVYAGERYEDVKKFIGKFFGTWQGVAASAIITISHMAFSYRSAVGGDTTYIQWIMKPLFSLIMVALLLHWAIVTVDCGGWRRRLRRFVSQASLFVFFIHCLVLVLDDILLRRLGVTRLSAFLLCRGVLVYAVSFGAWLVLRKLRLRVQKALH